MGFREDAEDKFIRVPENEFVDLILDVRETNVRKGITPKYDRDCWDFDEYDSNGGEALGRTGKILRVTSRALLRSITENTKIEWCFANLRIGRKGKGTETTYEVVTCKEFDPDQEKII